jgi:ABC-type branched-subunit amino acid transport system substrate-binding protein
MILVQNRPLQLSGNKLGWILLSCFCLGACSPKVKTTHVPPKNEVKKEKETVKETKKFTEANISLLLPFNLNQYKSRTATKAEIEKSAMVIDFYQGFKMGIDSAASKGLNFRIKVLDTRDNPSQVSTLIKSGQLAGSDLIVGPVFPDGIKFMTNYSIAGHVPVVSPLAASSPDEFNNPNLISIVNNIGLHAARIGDYIKKEYDPAKIVVVLINPKKSSDELMGSPVRNYFQQGKTGFSFQEYSSVYTMETNIVPDKQYVIILSSSDRQFVVATIDKLVKMKNNGLKADLFGHPNWIKQNYSTEKLQLLNTKITSSYTVDYKSSAVAVFIKNYRKTYSFEPGEYAFKGFDTGLYFGRLLAAYGADYMRHLTNEKYNGLHNSFAFVKDQATGYINTSLSLLEYKNYTLKPIE